MSQDALDALLDGKTPDEVITLIRTKAQAKHRAKQATLDAPPAMADEKWQRRKEWLLDPQPVYGVMTDYLWPALAALRADDQAEFSKQRDLLFKAAYTILGDPPPPAPPVIESAPADSGVPSEKA